MVYQWKKGSHFRGDVTVIKAELDDIGTNVTAQDVLSYASSNTKSALYGCFEWDDTKAGNQYRLVQARDLVRSIVIVPERRQSEQVSGSVQRNTDNPPTVRAYTHVQENGEPHYAATSRVVTNDDLLSQAMRQISEGIAALERKAASFAYLRSEAMSAVHEKLKEALTLSRKDTRSFQ